MLQVAGALLRHLVALVVTSLTFGLALGAADATAACPEPNPTDTSPCGLVFALPQWTSAYGWNQPQYYETIHLANIDGVPGDELLARGSIGLFVHEFDEDIGQWALVVQSGGAVADSRFSDANGWSAPQYYETLQTADLDGDGKAELLARFADGLRVFEWSTAQRTFEQIGQNGFFGDDSFGAPQYYETIQTGDVDGDGKREILGRDAELGMVVFQFDASTGDFTLLQPANALNEDFSDANGWDQPSYYETLRTADLDGDGADELLGRFIGGLFVFPYDATDNVFYPNGLLSDLGDDAGWTQPQYYRTIQAADVDGNGAREILARGPNGLGVYRWNASGTFTQLGALAAGFSDANGWAAPQYYATIQTGNVDATPGADLLARGSGGMGLWRWNGSGQSWVQMVFNQPALADDPWSDASLYRTIQTADVDGDGKADLVARGPYGVRTWTYEPGPQSFARPVPYGFPPFSGGEQQAFADLNTIVAGLSPGDTVREHYADDSADLAGWLQSLESRCTGQTSFNPPVYTNCTPPPGSSASGADWTAVSNVVMAELFWANHVRLYFSALWSDVFSKLFAVENTTELPSIDQDLKLAEAADKATHPDYAAIFENVLDFVGDLADAAGGEGIPFYMLASVIGAVTEATDIPPGPDPIAKTYTQVLQDVGQQQQQLEDTLVAQQIYVAGDGGLLAATGRLIDGQVLDVSQKSALGAQSAGRRAFAAWVYEAFLPTLWGKYVVTNCRDQSHGFQDVRCTALGPAPWVAQTDGVDFTALLALGSGCAVTPLGHGASRLSCTWNPPDANVFGTLVDPVSPQCTFDPSSSSPLAWEYGSCTLGVPTAELFSDWGFSTVDCAIPLGACLVGEPPPDAGDGAGSPPSVPQPGPAPAPTPPGEPDDGQQPSLPGFIGSVTGLGTSSSALVLSGAVASPDGLNLRRAAAQLKRMLFEHGGAGELVRRANGKPLTPLELHHAAPFRRGAATFVYPTPARGTASADARKGPRVVLKLRRQGTTVRLSLRVSRIAIGPPTACGDGGKTTLETRLVIRDAGSRAIRVPLVAPWTCVSGQHAAVTSLELNAR